MIEVEVTNALRQTRTLKLSAHAAAVLRLRQAQVVLNQACLQLGLMHLKTSPDPTKAIEAAALEYAEAMRDLMEAIER